VRFQSRFFEFLGTIKAPEKSLIFPILEVTLMRLFRFFAVMIAVFSFISLTPTLASAQSDYNKFEFFGGYTYQRNNWALLDAIEREAQDNLAEISGRNSNGFTFAATRNFSDFLGAKFQIGYTRSRINLSAFGDDIEIARLNKTSVMVGLQVKDNRKEGGKIRPFFHVMGGVNRNWLAARGVASEIAENLVGGDEISFTNFSVTVGGGLDLKVSDRFSVRAVQLDFNPTFTGNEYGGNQKDIKMSFGIVIH